MKQRFSSAAILAAFVLSACSGGSGTSMPNAGAPTAKGPNHVKGNALYSASCNPAAGSTVGQVTEYPLPWSGSGPQGIAIDRNGNAWVGAYDDGYLAFYQPSINSWTRYATYSRSSEPFDVAIDSNGYPWVEEYLGNRIATVRSGALTEYALSAPYGITSAPDGYLYVGHYSTGTTGGIYQVTTTSGSATQVATTGGTFDVSADSTDTIWGLQWMTGYNRVVKDVNGTITYTAIPTASSKPYQISEGPPGTGMWFVEYATNKIANVTPSGSIVEHTIPTANAEPLGLVAACGKIWFSESNTDKIGSFNPATSTFTEYPVPTASAKPTRLTVDANGNVWFSEYGSNKIAKIVTATAGSQPNGTMYISNSNGVTVYGAGVLAPPPTAMITGLASTWPGYSAIDWSGDFWIAEGSSGVAEYSGSANGNGVPLTTIQPPIDSYGVAVDQAGEVFVSDPNTSTIDVFPAGSSGAVKPIRIINGPDTGLNGGGLGKIIFDASNNLWAVNAATSSVLEFPASANGDAVPTQTLDSTWASNNGMSNLDSIAFKPDGTLAVLANNGEHVMVFAPGVSETSTYENTFAAQELNDIGVDSNGYLYGTSQAPPYGAFVYALGSTGTPPPYAIITGTNDLITGPFGISVANGVSGSARHALKTLGHPR